MKCLICLAWRLHLQRSLFDICTRNLWATPQLLLIFTNIDERVAALFELEEPSLVYNLWDHYGGRQSKFDMFWQIAKEYLEEEVGSAVDDRRHSTACHVAKAFSVLTSEKRLLKDVPRICLFLLMNGSVFNFFSACLLSHTALRYTGHLEVQHWVQQRQWRKEHEDAYYAACLFATRMSMLFWWEVTQTLLVLMTNIEWKLVNLMLQWLLRNEDDKLWSSLGCSYKQLTTILQNLVSYLWWFCCVTYQMKLEAHGNIGDVIKERRSI